MTLKTGNYKNGYLIVLHVLYGKWETPSSKEEAVIKSLWAVSGCVWIYFDPRSKVRCEYRPTV